MLITLENNNTLKYLPGNIPHILDMKFLRGKALKKWYIFIEEKTEVGGQYRVIVMRPELQKI